LRQLELPSHFVSIDLFANHVNFQEPFYMTKGNSAFWYN